MDWKRWLRLVGLVALLVFLYFAAPVSLTIHRDNAVRILVSVLTLVALAAGIVWQLRRHIDDTSKRADGLVISVVVVLVVFAHAFYVLQLHEPGQVTGLKTRLDALYFAMNTTTTVGTGDVHAEGQLARALVLVQMVFNVVFVATIAALLSARVKAAAVTRAQEHRGERKSS